MAKRTCDPTVGSIGPQVYLVGRFGQVVRQRVVPANPNTAAQRLTRGFLRTQAKAWDTILPAQRIAWNTAAKDWQSKTRLGMHGPLTGEEFFIRINCNLQLLGEDAVKDPPALPAIGDNALTVFTITNTGGVIALKFTAPTAVDPATILMASPPVRQGITRQPELYFIGCAPAAVTGVSTITGLYTTKFGAPPVGRKVFITAHVQTDGYPGPTTAWAAIVPGP
jgi:hypothetical protein